MINAAAAAAPLKVRGALKGDADMLTCDSCKETACNARKLEKMPSNCPSKRADSYPQFMGEYQKEENVGLTLESALVEKEGYCRWNRVREVIELSRRMGYKKIGVAFCVGLKKEAKIFCKILRERGFDVEAVSCKNGAYDKTDLDIPEEGKKKPGSARTMDWEQDESILFPAINKIAGFETRSVEYLHWWTFMGYFMEISTDGVFGSVLRLRQKKKNRKTPLDKTEKEFWNANRELCEIKPKLSEEEKAAKERLKNMLR